jgi:hypothetical protein
MKAWLWMIAGVYFAVAAINGSGIAAAATLACGWFAGRGTAKKEAAGG